VYKVLKSKGLVISSTLLDWLKVLSSTLDDVLKSTTGMDESNGWFCTGYQGLLTVQPGHVDVEYNQTGQFVAFLHLPQQLQGVNAVHGFDNVICSPKAVTASRKQG
jgi:hypothetical protein